jgi:hypothetical protein
MMPNHDLQTLSMPRRLVWKTVEAREQTTIYFICVSHLWLFVGIPIRSRGFLFQLLQGLKLSQSEVLF